MRCKPWEPPDYDQAGGSNAHIYTILEESEPSEETIDPLDPGTQEDSEPCPQLTNEKLQRRPAGETKHKKMKEELILATTPGTRATTDK